MGALNCKDREDVGPIIDTVFSLNYMMLALHTEAAFTSWWNPVIMFGNVISWMTLFTMLNNNMFQLGAVVDCAVDNNVLGPDTASRFVDYSAMYSDWAFIHLFYFLFVDPFVMLCLAVILFVNMSVGLWALGTYRAVVDFGATFANLYLTNAVYEGFHPVLAPEISNN